MTGMPKVAAPALALAASTATGRLRRRWSVLVAVALAASLAPVAASGTPAQADQPVEHLVGVGADDPGSPALPAPQDRFEYLAYYPDTLKVRRGDIVRFDYRGDHSVTFYPGGVRRDSLLVPDELEGQVRLDGFFPSRDDCAFGVGAGDLPPCVLSSSDQFLNAGTSVGDPDYIARIQVDLPPGTYSYFCVFHRSMRGEIEVVEQDEEIPTPAEVEAERQAQVRRDTAAAEAVVASHQAPAPVIVDGRARWQVQVGGSTPDGRVGILSYLPSDLQIAPGDEVEFVVPESPGEYLDFHSVSFLPDAVREVAPAHYMESRCDLDGRDSGAPGVGVSIATVIAGCPKGEIEVLWNPLGYAQPLRSPGGIVAGSSPVHDSGAMVPRGVDCTDRCDPWTGEPLPDRFFATFPAAGDYGYWCFLHDGRGMTGSISVVDAAAPASLLR